MPLSRVQRYLKHGSLPQLVVFEACARLGSFTRAAEELHMAQPTVSTQVRKLADTVGLPLFEQIGRRVYLTEAGHCLYGTCSGIFGMVEKLEHRLESLRGLDAGRLRLAVSSAGKYFVPRLLAGFVQRHTGVEVSLEIHNRRGLINRLSDNLDDLYVFTHPPTDLNTVHQAIMPNPMVFFASASHPLASERDIPLSRIADEPFLMREPGSGTRMAVEDIFADAGLRLRVRMELSTNESIKQAILAGLGISFMSRYTLGLDTDHGGLVALDVRGFPLDAQWYFVYPVGKEVSVVARSFMDFVRTEARHMVIPSPSSDYPVVAVV